MLKRCFRCGRFLDLDEFYRHPEMADGRLGKCKECTKGDSRAVYRADPRAANRRRSERRTPEQRRKNTERYHERYPERTRANGILARAVRSGRLLPQPCESCGSTERAHGHHDDYGKPLEVRWLCRACHSKAHRRLTW